MNKTLIFTLAQFYIRFYAFPLFSGTGSYPPFEKGLHLSILQRASIDPFNAPNLSIASIAY